MLMLTLVAQLALSAGPSQLTIDVKPEGVEVQVDGKKVGTSGKPLVVKVTPGRHQVRMTYKGDAHEEEVEVKANEKKTCTLEFDTGNTVAPIGE
jgi:hypothetical protein